MFAIALGYVGFRADGLEDWRSYGSNLLGFQAIDKGPTSLAFRMDDRKQRVLIDGTGGRGISFIGWEVADAQALAALGARLERFEIHVERGSSALASQRCVEDLIVFEDPIGTRLEAFHGGAVATDPFKPGRSISGFRTGPLGVGHLVFSVDRIEELSAFYETVLGFGLSDFYSHPFPARFLHINQRHHSLAFIQNGGNTVHHLMIELYSFDDVGQGLDIANDEDRVSVTLGRHFGDKMTSFYTKTPSDFLVEYGWGGESIDPKTWQPKERVGGPSLWGHERNWLPANKREAARLLRRANADNGMRFPVQVIDGNYQRMEGVCPWWDQMPRKERSR